MPCSAKPDEISTILPHFLSTMDGITALSRWNVPSRLPRRTADSSPASICFQKYAPNHGPPYGVSDQDIDMAPMLHHLRDGILNPGGFGEIHRSRKSFGAGGLDLFDGFLGLLPVRLVGQGRR